MGLFPRAYRVERMGKMIKKIHRASVWFVLFGSIFLLFFDCARNTRGEQYDDGRVYFIVDLNPDWFATHPERPIERGRVIIRYTLEGEEPVSDLVYTVADWSGVRFDLVDRSIEGGTEVSVSVYTEHQGVRQGGSATFDVDGNTTLRFRLRDKEDRASQLILVME